MRNPLTIEAFAEWCEKQPARKRYDYNHPCACAIAQYLEASGFDVAYLGNIYWAPRGYDGRRLPAGFSEASMAQPQTFGALAARLRSGAYSL